MTTSFTNHAPLAVFILAAITAVGGTPALGAVFPPYDGNPEQYYGGFYPTEAWLDSLEQTPRDQRGNPRIASDHSLSDDEIDELKSDVRHYMKVEPADLIGLVPHRNRIAGNSRVMPGRNRRSIPDTPDGETVYWRPTEPDKLFAGGEVFDPYEAFPPTGEFVITGPQGETQRYPYHDQPDGKRIYVQSEYMDALRTWSMYETAQKLGLLYRHTGDEAYAKRAAAILYDFATAVKHWPKIARGIHSGLKGKDRFRPVDEHIVYADIWHDKYHSGVKNGPEQLAISYDAIINTPVWDEFDAVAESGDARDVIERDLFAYTFRDAIRYDIAFPHPKAALSNYIPYQCRGLICIGKATGYPELIHYATWKLEQMAEKTLMADRVFPEGPSYFRQHVGNMLAAMGYADGYSDPEGFISSIDNRRYEDLNLTEDLPVLGSSWRTLNQMTYPNGAYMTVDDTHYHVRESLSHEVTRSILFPSYGHAILGRGTRERGNQFQAHLSFTGNWGHDHQDMLNIILWAYVQEMVCDMGYVHSYRGFSEKTIGHNTVVVDRRPQDKVGEAGRMVAYHPLETGVGYVEAFAPHVYEQADAYRRALITVPVGDDDNIVFDLFDVAGGKTHEWMANGSAMIEQTLSVTAPTEYVGESYADDGSQFTPPPYAELAEQRQQQGKPAHHLAPGEPDPWYGVFRDVHRGTASEPFTATFDTDAEDHPRMRLHVLNNEPLDVITATVPALRRGGESPANIKTLTESIRMPRLVLRRDGEGDLRSRFLVVWEPVRPDGGDVVEQVDRLDVDQSDAVALHVRTTRDDASDIRIYYSPDPDQLCVAEDGTRWRGRCAVIAGDKAYLYSGTSLHHDDLHVTVNASNALPLRRVDGHDMILAGAWPGLADDAFADQRYVILSQDGSHHRAVPVTSASTERGRVRLHGPRHPGFNYDNGVLTEQYAPFNTIEGKAQVELPSRTVLERTADGAWRVVTSSHRATTR